MTQRLRESLAALRGVFANPDLRRLQIAWFGANIGHFSYFLAISVFAFEAGGAGAVGVAAVARMAPAAIATPFAAALADRHSRQRLMVAADLSRAMALCAAAVAILADLPAAVAIALAAIAAVVGTPFEPAKSALIPSLARTPEELTAANLASSTIESVTLFLGPAVGGAILAATGPGEALFFSAACLLWSAAFVAGVRGEGPASEEREPEPLIREAAAGFRAIASEPRLRLVVGLIAAQTLVFGAESVLSVVLALELLGIGNAGLGYLNSAVGIGAFLGAAATLGLVGARRLGRGLGFGVALWGIPLVVVGLVLNEPLALAMMATIGLANTLVDVSGFTLLQRLAPKEVLARVFGVLETLIIATVALGSLLAPLLIEAFGARAAFVAVGALLPALSLLSWRALSRLDAAAPAPTRELELLEGVPLFAPLGPAAREELAERLVPLRVADGERIITQGEVGERFYIVAAGEVAVSVDGRHVDVQGPGSYFGEIALLRDVPRTATVSARGEVELRALERDDFIDAVVGHPRSSAAAEAVIGFRLGRARPAQG